MTPEKEAELFATLANMGRMMEAQGRILEAQGRMVEKVIATQEKIIATQEKHIEQIAEVKGQISMLALWLQSTDQRFTAIMAPYQQKPQA